MRCRIIALLLALLLAGCALAEESLPLTAEDLIFAYEGKTYRLLTDPTALIAAIAAHDGEEMTVEEAPSCLYDGMDKEYSGQDLVLGTHPTGKDGGDLLETILIVDGEWATARGIAIGSTKEQVIAAYGENFMEDYDQMIYAIGEPYESPMVIFQLDLDTQQVIAIFLMAYSA